MPAEKQIVKPTRSPCNTKARKTIGCVDELNEDKLKQLLTFIGQLERTPPGAAELQRRIKLFGQCKRGENETSGQFCARLRQWLDRSLPKTKSPLHAPRQTSD